MEPPIKPNDSDCCNSGCNPCIFDVYEEQLKKYQKSLKDNKNFQSNIVNCISQTSFTKFKLIQRKKFTNKSYLFTFTFSENENKDQQTCLKLTYKPGQYFMLKAQINCDNNELVTITRAYTPIPLDNLELTSSNHQAFTVLIKLYEKGLMSNYVKSLELNSETLWRGPYGDYTINLDKKYIVFIAQGTGIAPLFALIVDLLQNEDYEGFLHLIFCCTSCEEIYLRDELYKLKDYWNFNYTIYLSVCSNITRKYNEVLKEHRLTSGELQKFYTKFADKRVVNTLICGSDSFNESINMIVKDCDVYEEEIKIF